MAFGRFPSASARFFSRSKRPHAAAQPNDALVPCIDMRELARRTVPRDVVDCQVNLILDPQSSRIARLMDISPYGFQARAGNLLLDRGMQLGLILPLVGERPADVMWGLKGLFGCKFIEPIEFGLYTQLLKHIRDMPSDLDPA